MLGAGQAVLRGAGALSEPQTYTGLVDSRSPISHWPLLGLSDRKGISAISAFGAHETGLPPIAQLDGGSARGFNGANAYGTIAHASAYQVATGGVFVLMQPDRVAAKMQVFNSGTTAAGSMALEVDANGQPRAYRRRSDGSLVTVAGSAGQIVAGTSYLYGVSWGPNGLRLWLMDEDLQPGLVASNPEPNWATITDTATKYLGRWSGSATGHFDGVLGHLQFYGAELSQAQIATLARPQLVVWLGNIDAGAVEQNATMTIDLAAHAHPASGFTPSVVAQGARGTASASGEDIAYAAGATVGNNDTFTAKITAGGVASGIATVTIDVEQVQGGFEFTCLARSSGTLQVPGGTTDYQANHANNTRYDARGKTWVRTLGTGQARLPIALSGADGGCWSGGAVWGDQSLTQPRLSTSNFGNSKAMVLGSSGTINNFLIEGLRVHNFWDGLVLAFQNNAAGVTLRGSWFSHMRDDCIENDQKRDGLLVDDCLFDGAFMLFSCRDNGGSNADAFTQTIRNTLARLKPTPGMDAPPDPGHGFAFKLNSRAVRFDLFDNIFAWQQGTSLQVSNDVPGVSNDPLYDLSPARYDKLGNSSGNTICWLGAGSYPSGWWVPPGFTVLTGATAQNAWNNAASGWKAAHPQVHRIPGVDD